MNTNKNLCSTQNKLNKPLYNLEYWIDDKLIETIMRNKPISQCISFGKSLKSNNSNYRLGTFKNKQL